MNWEEARQGEWRCVDSRGRIVARIIGHQGEYHASYESQVIGTYVSLETAKTATEAHARPVKMV